MNIRRFLCFPIFRPYNLLLLSAFSFPLFSFSAFGQGSLTPPGAPAPTMKTLDQVEARTPIAGGSNAVTISQAGSYYLTGNLTVASGNAITIATSGVTLDLMGFTISSTANPAAGSGIVINSLLKNLTILNGSILGAVTYNGSSYTGAGFQNGINVASGSIAPRNVRVSGVSVAGCTLNGIFLGNTIQTSAMVDHCLVGTIGSTGIQAGSVSDCVVSECGGAAINCFIANNSAGDATGSLTAIAAKTAVNCIGASATGIGIKADVATGCRGESTALGSNARGLDAGTASNCYGYVGNGTGEGLHATSATGCYGYSNQGGGLNTITAANCFGQSQSDGIGLNVFTAIGSLGQSAGSGDGLHATSVSSSYGSSNSGNGIYAINASNCFGSSNSSYGLYLPANLGYGTASFCRGTSTSGYGIFAEIGIGCTYSGNHSIGYPYLMPLP
jgi:hypothetical protein